MDAPRSIAQRNSPSIFFPAALLYADGEGPTASELVTVVPSLAAEYRYTIRVDMYRKGLRRHERMSLPNHALYFIY